MVNGAQSRSKLWRISKAKSSIRSCIGHKYVYVYELGCRIVALKSWYPYFRSDNPETPETTFMNETATESPRLPDSGAFTVHGPPWHGLEPVSISNWTLIRRLIVRSREVPKPQDLCLNCPIALKFERHLGSSVTETSLSNFSNRRENIN